ncbi:MAG: FAD-binding oxidoreductase [Myxococcales bacterium]|nr:FAD-binding oxidoreductase [Myxococcales bacterium]
MTRSTRIVGWGGIGTEGEERLSEDLVRISEGVPIARGLGRSYGDSAVPPPSQPVILGTTLADRILSFDESSGVLRAESGLSLYELNRIFLPRRFFVPVTPGTQFVTLGGMVASDVHGKNHHVEGCFGEHVLSLKMRTGTGEVIECSKDVHADLFYATIGGMGLTGHILEVSFQMRKIPSCWIYQETERVADLDTLLDALGQAAEKWPMTVAWIDCLHEGRHMGRGILYRGRWATEQEAPAYAPKPKIRLRVPFQLPSWAMGKQSVRLFNSALYHQHIPRVRKGIVSPEEFFYPLDAIRDWNRIYGKQGFTQHQAVLPASKGRAAVRRFLELLTSLGGASFLCVLKDCGAQGSGMLSFPMPGTSIAMDLALRAHTQTHIDRLNELVIREGGRIYLTKDALTRPEHFAQMEPRLSAWQKVRDKWDPTHRVRSAQSVRLFGDKP